MREGGDKLIVWDGRILYDITVILCVFPFQGIGLLSLSFIVDFKYVESVIAMWITPVQPYKVQVVDEVHQASIVNP